MQLTGNASSQETIALFEKYVIPQLWVGIRSVWYAGEGSYVWDAEGKTLSRSISRLGL